MKEILTKEEELQLGEIVQGYKTGKGVSYDEYIEARNKLIEHNMNFAMSRAHKFKNSYSAKTYEREDAIQDSLFALVKEADKYNPEFNTKLATFAGWGIDKELSIKSYKSGKIPLNSSAGGKLVETKRLLEEKPEDSPLTDFQYIKEKKNYKDSEILTYLSILSGVSSLNHVITGSDNDIGELSDFIEDKTQTGVDDNIESDYIRGLLLELEDNERLVIQHKYKLAHLDLTKDDFLEKYNLTNREYLNISLRSLNKLRRIVKNDKFAF